MNKSFIFIALLVAAGINAEVVELNKENFNSTVLENQYVLTMYYDPFNNLCKKFLPKFDKMSNDLSDMVLAKLNGEKEVDIADEQGVDDYPSWELFVWGVPIKYHKHDSVIALKEWVANKTAINYSTASSASELGKEDFELYFTTSDDSPLDRLMSGIQKKHEDMKIFRLSASLARSVASQNGVSVSGGDAVFARRLHDGHAQVYNGNIDAFELEKWIVANEYPDVSNFSQQSLVWLNKEELPILFFFHDGQNTNSTWIENIREAAPDVKGIALTVLADTNDSAVQEFAASQGFTNFPTLAVVEPDTPNRRYLCRKTLKNVTKKTVINCAHDFEARDLRRFYKSEEPVAEAERNVQYITGRSFGKQVFSNFDKYHLVFFYNSESQNLVEPFTAFAEQVGQQENFSFAVFNMDRNEHRQVLHIAPGSLLFFSPDDDNIAEIKPESMNEKEIFTFLEDKAPSEIYDQINAAYKGQGDL
eukprot:TRINITY_DN10081_c0_g1_i1.p1 TRINITY_DN10081_c0_g1~~TRINITY_DN10081_c0_g1_i1.p1  ORF type:complete len:476 (-),score=94.81 TRINITY_DN10081_c0_g1_i1:12-1439(-)